MTEKLWVMPTEKSLREACDVIHEARMAMHNEDEPVKAMLLPIPGNDLVTARYLVGNALNAGHDALWLLSRAQHELDKAKAKRIAESLKS